MRLSLIFMCHKALVYFDSLQHIQNSKFRTGVYWGNTHNVFWHLYVVWKYIVLTHWGRVTHICVGKLTIIGSDNGLSHERRQAIIWTNAGILLIRPLRTNFSENLIEIQTFSLMKIRSNMSSAKCCSFRLGLNVLAWSYILLDLIYCCYWSFWFSARVCVFYKPPRTLIFIAIIQFWS